MEIALYDDYEEMVTQERPEKIQYKILDENFYRGMRNEMTVDRLHLLKKLVTKIEQPELYGTYKNEKHFLDVFDFFLMTTNETRQRGIFLLREVLPRLKAEINLLDVGCGTGKITKWVGSHFKHLTLLDTNLDAIVNFNKSEKLVRNRTEFEAICASILEVKLRENFYSLGLLSHVLYYINDSRWLEATQRVYDAVARGGFVLIAINGDQCGKADLIKRFNGKPIKIEPFIEKCRKHFPKTSITIFKSKEVARSLDVNTMLQIAGFFLHDGGGKASRTDLLSYIEKFLKKEDGTYEIDFVQKFILIKK